MLFLMRSCEWLDLVGYELRVDPKLGVSCERSQVRCGVRALIEINAMFGKCLCGDTFSDHLKIESRAASKGVWGMSYLPWKRFCWQFRLLSTCPTVYWELLQLVGTKLSLF